MKFNKVFSSLLINVLAVTIVSSAPAFAASTSVKPAGPVKSADKKTTDTSKTEVALTAFQKAYAYLDYKSAPASKKELILTARREIVYGNTAWTVNGKVSIINADGTETKLPEFKDLFPGWKLEDLTAKNSYNSDKDMASNSSVISSGSPGFEGNVYIPNQYMPMASSADSGREFYQFNALADNAYTWAYTLPYDSKFNVAYRSLDTNTDMGWVPNIE